MKLQEFLLVLFCIIAVTLSASVSRQRREGNSLLAAEEESLQLSSNAVRVTREADAADDDYDADGKIFTIKEARNMNYFREY